MEEISVPQELSGSYSKAVSYDAEASLSKVYFSRPKSDYESCFVGDYR